MPIIDMQHLFEEMMGQAHQLRSEDTSGFPALHTPTHYSPAGIPYLTAPGVVVLSKPALNMAGLADFLQGFDPALQFPQYLADPTPLPDGAQLCKVAGQLCYMSFAPKRTMNAQAKKYFDNIKSSGHGCYDEETEVLTSEGWKHWQDVKIVDKLATLNKEGIIEYHVPKKLIKYHHKGRMYRVESSGVDLLVTPDHKMYACQTTTKEGREKSNYTLIPCVELDSKAHAYTKVGKWESSKGTIDKNILALLGFSIGDGYIDKKYHTVRFHLRRDRKIEWLRHICHEIGWDMKVEDEDDKFSVHIHADYRDLFHSIYDKEGNKVIPQWLLLESDRESLKSLLNGMLEADGCKTDTGDIYDTTSKVLADQFQQLALHVGISANISQASCYKERRHSIGDKPIYRLSLVTRKIKPEVNKFAGCDGKSYWVEEWEGNVFCAEVENNTLYVRRNGKPVWSGNSVLEHANYTLLLYGISRSVTHELIRHRSGFGYSQLSQRFVSGKMLRFVERPEYQTDDPGGQAPSLHEQFIQRIERAASEYTTLTERLLAMQKAGSTILSAEARTDLRKKVQQTARSVLPNETEAPIVVTGNTRAWRHVIEERASAHAETEIRALAIRILLCLRVADPVLFDDYSIEELADGTYVAQTEFRKV